MRGSKLQGSISCSWGSDRLAPCSSSRRRCHNNSNIRIEPCLPSEEELHSCIERAFLLQPALVEVPEVASEEEVRHSLVVVAVHSLVELDRVVGSRMTFT